jgi:hypothetical protein
MIDRSERVYTYLVQQTAVVIHTRSVLSRQAGVAVNARSGICTKNRSCTSVLIVRDACAESREHT